MKKFDGKHRKKIGRKKRELIAWRARRAQAMFGGNTKRMREFCNISGNPLFYAERVS